MQLLLLGGRWGEAGAADDYCSEQNYSDQDTASIVSVRSCTIIVLQPGQYH